jgi:hypothetical protein
VKTVLFSFSRPTGYQAHAKIARYLSDLYDIPCLYGEDVANHIPDLLLLVAGAFAFCSVLPAVAVAVERAKRIVWVQNDYTIVPPKPISAAQSPFRAAFRRRRELGRASIDYWTTIGDNARVTPRSAYVNWNLLAWNPPSAPTPGRRSRTLLYYGAYRAGRVPYFDRYFLHPVVHTVVSGKNQRFSRYNHEAEWVPPFEDLNAALRAHGLGLYLEDKTSHTHYHSPSTRFYEMLGASLPMVFQPEAEKMMREYGYDIHEYVIHEPAKDLPRMMRARDIIAERQHDAWMADFPKILKAQVRAAQKRLEQQP